MKKIYIESIYGGSGGIEKMQGRWDYDLVREVKNTCSEGEYSRTIEKMRYGRVAGVQ
jgi:hypothetical protein